MNTWRNIDTAPRDGTHILACEDDVIALVWWEESTQQWRDYGDMGAAGMTVFEPTHWMPLPKFPADGSAKHTLRRIANIAHHGGLLGMDAFTAVKEIRKLSLPWWDRDEVGRLQRQNGKDETHDD